MQFSFILQFTFRCNSLVHELALSINLFSAVGDILLNDTCPCDNVKIPYNLNCNKYYECENGELLLKDCETGKLFDQNDQTCLSTSRAMCIPDPSFEAGKQ